MTKIYYFTFNAIKLDNLIICVTQPIWPSNLIGVFLPLESHSSCNYIDCNILDGDIDVLSLQKGHFLEERPIFKDQYFDERMTKIVD